MLTLLLAFTASVLFAQEIPVSTIRAIPSSDVVLTEGALQATSMSVCEATVRKQQGDVENWTSLGAGDFRSRSGAGVAFPCSPDQARAMVAPVAPGRCAVIVLQAQTVAAEGSRPQDIDLRLVTMGATLIDELTPMQSELATVALCNRGDASAAAQEIQLSGRFYSSDASAPATANIYATRFDIDVAQTMTIQAFRAAGQRLADLAATPEQIAAATTVMDLLIAERESNSRMPNLSFANPIPAFANLPHCVVDMGLLPRFQQRTAENLSGCSAPQIASLMAAIAPHKCAVIAAVGTVEGDIDLALSLEGQPPRDNDDDDAGGPSFDSLKDVENDNIPVVYACNATEQPIPLRIKTRRYRSATRQALITRFDFDAGAAGDGQLTGAALDARRAGVNARLAEANARRMSRAVVPFLGMLRNADYSMGQFFSTGGMNLPFSDSKPICIGEFPRAYGAITVTGRDGEGGHACSATRREGRRTLNDISAVNEAVPGRTCVIFIATSPFGDDIDLRIRFPGRAPQMNEMDRLALVNEESDPSPFVFFCNNATTPQRIILEGRDYSGSSPSALILRYDFVPAPQ